jgi:galactokinase
VDKRTFSTTNGVVTIEDDNWKGYLANISPKVFEEVYEQHIPMSMLGEEFIKRYCGSIDTIAKIDPKTSYNGMLLSFIFFNGVCLLFF